LKSKIKQSPKKPAELRRSQLIAEARKLFLKKGYRGTNVDEISRKARLTKGAFYHHFDSKEDVLLAMFKEMSKRYQRAFGSIDQQGVSPVDFLKTLLNIHEPVHPSEFSNMVDIWVQGSRIPRIHNYLERRHLQHLEVLAKNLDRSYGRTLKQRRELAIFTFAFFEGLAIRRSRWPNLVDVDGQIRLFTQLVEAHKRKVK